MNYGSRDFLEKIQSKYSYSLPPMAFNEKLSSRARMSYIFLLSAQMLNIMTGALAIVTLKELSRDGEWANSEFSLEIVSFIEIAWKHQSLLWIFLPQLFLKQSLEFTWRKMLQRFAPFTSFLILEAGI